MNLTLRQVTRGTVLSTLFLAALALTVSEAQAHWRPFRHRHPHRRAVIVVGRPVAVRNVVHINGRPHGSIDFSVDPSTTEVYVNGKLRGTVDDFDGSPQKLHLIPGQHTISLKTPDGQNLTKQIDIRAGTEINLKLDFD